MRVVGVVLVVLLCLCREAAGVQVQVGDQSFPLEAAKQLKELMDLDDHVDPRPAETSVTAVCSNPLLPLVFVPVCQGKGAGVVFSELVLIITASDPCEICASPACFGCLD